MTSNSKKCGKFITIEGQDGSGKTTNLNYVCDFLRSNYQIEPLITREPGGTELGEQVRELLLGENTPDIGSTAELLLIFAARAQHLESVIMPALTAGTWVVCDRFTDATYAYQGAGRGLSTTNIATLETLVQNGMKPDLTLLLDVDVNTGEQRVEKRAEHQDRFEQQHLAFKQRVREYYLTLTNRHPERVKHIDAGQNLNAVQEQIAVSLERYMQSIALEH